MADSDNSPPGALSWEPRDPEVPILREHFRDLTRWVIGDAVGDRLSAGESDALAEEIAVILSSGLAPALHREIQTQAEATIESMHAGILLSGHPEEIPRGTVFRLQARYPYEKTVEFMFADTPPGADGRMGLVVTTGYRAGSWVAVLPEAAYVPGRLWTLSASWLRENWAAEIYAETYVDGIVVRPNRSPVRAPE